MNRTKIFGLTIAAVSLVLIIFQASNSESSVTFYTPQEIYESLPNFENKTFRVSGLVVKDSKQFDPQTMNLKFKITDLKGNNFDVEYKGVPPDLFKEGQGVVIEGKLDHKSLSLQKDRMISAHLLMVKHSEVYDTKSEHSNMKQAKLLDSMSQ